MARVPEEEIERLKREIPIQRLAEAKGVELTAHGGNLIGLCPFHEDREPSLVITPAKNLWHCMGACQTGGSVIDWVMKAEGVSFRHAVEILRGGPSSLAASSVPMGQSRKLPPVLAMEAEDREILRQAIDYYHATLKESPEALQYLEKRGLRSSEMIERFKLGYANRTLGYRLPPKRCKAGSEIRGRLTRLGIYRPSGHEHFTGSLVIPVFDEAGNVTEIYGRKIRDDLSEKSPTHLYLPGLHKGVWNIEVFTAAKEIILCEALIDALTFWCLGFRNVTASYGTSGFTEDHMSAFKRYGTERVLIAYDRDDAGDRAAEALSEKLMKEGIGCYRIRFPRGMDANEYALKVSPADRSLGVLIRSAAWLGAGKVNDAETCAESPGREENIPPALKEKIHDSDIAARAGGNGRVGQGAPPREPLPFLAALPEIGPNGGAKAPVREEKEVPDPPSLTASPVIPEMLEPVPAEIKPEEVVISLSGRRWRVRGLSKNMTFGQLRVNVLLSVEDRCFVDTLDLYSAKQRAGFIKAASQETGVKEDEVKKDLGKVLLKLEEIQEDTIKSALEPKEKKVTPTDAEREEALSLLKDPNLLSRIAHDFDRCGLVGEETNKLTGYLAAVSRKLDSPLAITIQSSSAAGKTMLMESILSFIPEEDRVKYSAMTGQSLFYMGETNLKHKVLAIVEEEGAQEASYALKLLQSEGELTIASTGKDPATGRLTTHEYRVEGPVMAFVTTTAIDLDEEFLNRCIVLTVSEEREQTRAIHRLQRERRTIEGFMARKERRKILRTHQNAQRLLRKVEVLNPYAPKLTFLDDRTRTRRDHEKYLTLIDSIALLHQYQRPIKDLDGVSFIEVTLDDIDVANRLSCEVLGRSLDEMPPQTRRFLSLLHRMVSDECARQSMDQTDYRFRRREACEYTGWSLTQVRAHLERLIELEFVLTHRGGRGQSFVYELLYRGEGSDGKPFLMGLLDVKKLQRGNYDAEVADSQGRVAEPEGELSGPKRVQNGGKTAPNRAVQSGDKPFNGNDLPGTYEASPQNALIGKETAHAAVASSTSGEER